MFEKVNGYLFASDDPVYRFVISASQVKVRLLSRPRFAAVNAEASWPKKDPFAASDKRENPNLRSFLSEHPVHLRQPREVYPVYNQFTYPFCQSKQRSFGHTRALALRPARKKHVVVGTRSDFNAFSRDSCHHGSREIEFGLRTIEKCGVGPGVCVFLETGPRPYNAIVVQSLSFRRAVE